MGFRRDRAGKTLEPHLHAARRVCVPLHAASVHEGRRGGEVTMTTTRKALSLLFGAICGGAIALACFTDRSGGPRPTTSADCRVPVTALDSIHYNIVCRD